MAAPCFVMAHLAKAPAGPVYVNLGLAVYLRRLDAVEAGSTSIPPRTRVAFSGDNIGTIDVVETPEALLAAAERAALGPLVPIR